MDMFSTQVLLGVVANLKRLQNGLLRAFFNTVSQSTEETIAFDVDEGKRYMAPFVSAEVPGRVKQMRGQQVKSFNPAYIKQKARWNPNRAIKRSAGESFGTPLSPEARRQAALAAELQDQIDHIDRRLEWMAARALVDAAVTVEGDGYPSTVVDFGRAAGLSGLVPTVLWSVANAKPLDDLAKYSDKAVKESGSTTPNIVMDIDGWQAFRGNAQVEKRLDLIKLEAGSLSTTEIQSEGLVLRGAVDGFRIWTYQSWFIDAAGVEQPMLASGTVLGIGAIDGVQHFGAILDDESLQAVPVFPKSWPEQDPSGRWIMTQSAPLVVPRRVNGSWKAGVL